MTLPVTDITEAFAIPGESSIIDCINPETGLTWIAGETLEQVRLRYPGAERVNLKAFCEAKAQRQDCAIQWGEISEGIYKEWFECLPPAEYGHRCFLIGEPADHHATNGQPRYQAAKFEGGKYYASSRPMTRKEFKSL